LLLSEDSNESVASGSTSKRFDTFCAMCRDKV
jgi:hypothetical protein